MTKTLRPAFMWLPAILLTIAGHPRTIYGLEPGPGVCIRHRAVTVDPYTRIHLTFDKLNQGKFTNTVSDSVPGDVHGRTLLVPGIAGNALQTDDGVVTVSCRAFGPELHAFSAQFWMRRGTETGETLVLDVAGPDDSSLWQLRLASSEERARLVWSVGGVGAVDRRELVSNRGLDESDRWYRVSLVLGSPPGSGGSTALRIYLDGYVVAEEPWFGKIGMGTDSVLRVRSPRGGAIDELSVSMRPQDVFHEVADHPLAPRNLDFEEGAEGWVGVYEDCVIDDSTVHGGKHSLRIETDDAYTREYLSPIFSVETGATYRVHFWAKVDRWETGYSAISLWCRWYFEPEETCSFGGDLVAHCVAGDAPRTFDWREFIGEVTVPVDKAYWRPVRWARFQVKNYHSHVLAWIDDIRVERIDTKEARRHDR